jgi:hypothetical protein
MYLILQFGQYFPSAWRDLLITYRFHAWWQPSGKGIWKWWSGWWITSHSFRAIRKWLDTFQLSVTRYDYYDKVVSYGKYLDTISGFSICRMYNLYILYTLPCVRNVILVQSCILWFSYTTVCFVLRIFCVVILIVALSTLYLCYFL